MRELARIWGNCLLDLQKNCFRIHSRLYPPRGWGCFWSIWQKLKARIFTKNRELVFMFKSLQVGYQLIHKEIMPWVEAQVVKKEDS